MGAATVGILLAAGISVGAGTAHADTSFAEIPYSEFEMRSHSDRTESVDAHIAADPRLSKVGLDAIVATGTGKAGLCYPTPFNPGVDADGYCWNNSEDDSGSTGWAPQGLSVPHHASSDGTWNSKRWEVTSWHDSGDLPAKLRFVDRSSATPRYIDVLLAEFNMHGELVQLQTHADSVVWYGDNLLVGSGAVINVFRLTDLLRAQHDPSGFPYVLPLSAMFRTPENGGTPCAAVSGDRPCLNSLSFDRANGALLSSEWVNDPSGGGRIVRWPFDLNTGLPKVGQASGAWVSPIVRMQGAVYAQGTFFMSGYCPASFDKPYREQTCVHKATPNSATYVLTAVPDMTQNLDWDSSTGRVRGINEVVQADQPYRQRLVFDFSPSARPITTFRLKNVSSGKCLLPYGGKLQDGITIVQWGCNGTSSQNWFWDGTQIRNFQSSGCMTVYGGSTSNGAVINQWECNGSAAQQWYKASSSAGGVLMVNSGSNLCLTIYGGSSTDGAEAVQWSCNSTSPAHAWTGSSV
ncbi:RICIN domain-containing protein [Streptomyces sp. NPDC059875]|uniref:RICIN domain-containing protein n=1 Tax=unclassified Streptomyces TaxID=2593676 RepID=UPI00365CC42A